ncbi:hypothetical protein CFC21_061602 [Triticum aestivum]|uniref:Uncharacterized protein n=2 Tax=Triticum aestivum TaxID=4565 RepID=A0A9R1GU22_WHEAT|nr:hypothetical protein CFC21_061602 [Triticum aestivum]
MAPLPGQTKRILEPDEPAPDRVTRQKAKMAAATEHQESLLCMDSETLVQMGDELPPMDRETTLRMDESGTVCLDEGGTIHTDLSPVAPSVNRNDVISEEEQQLVLQLAAMTTKTRLRKGKGLERITKSLGSKVPIQVAGGMKRPEKPLQAAKLASECGLVARSHLPVLPHFKQYKKMLVYWRTKLGKLLQI